MEIRDGMIYWPELCTGRLLKRYKRFLADVGLDSGDRVTVHCPNSGSMRGCCEPGRRVYLSRHETAKRKYPYTWELIDMQQSLVGVNTLVPNRLVAAAVRAGQIGPLAGYEKVTAEVRAGVHSRLDLMLSSPGGRRCYVEIKNCTLVEEGGVACFPDAATARGRQHLKELQDLAAEGERCVIFFLIQRMDAEVFGPADHIDPAFGAELRRAAEKGVEILAYDALIDIERIALGRRLPVRL
jgi:sugar fermentation stimulation protein A